MITADRITRIGRDEAPRLAAEAYDRLLTLLRELDDADWRRPTECEPWDVRALVSHVVGAMESCASLREQAHQVRAGRRLAKQRRCATVDGINDVQVRERAALGPDALLRRYAEVAPKAVRGRRRTPGPIRRLEVGDEATGPLRMGELVDVIYTRDAWLHRVDVARAVDRELHLTPEHDGRIVADVVADWAGLHGQPFELHLDGPAGGHFRQAFASAAPEAEVLELDAIEYCRIVSGRAPATGLLATPVLF